MALPRPIVSAAIVCASSLAFVAPANAASSNPLRSLADILSATAKKQTNPETALLTANLADTLRNVGSLIYSKPDPACAAQATTKPFAPWRDNADYVPAPNGGFEDGLSTWSAIGPVAVTNENNPFFISGNPADDSSVTLASGGSISSASFCGGLDHPTVRMMARSTDGKPAKALVTVRYTGRDGLLAALPLGTITAGSSWQPSEVTLTASGLPLLTGTKLGVTITATSGSIVLDDIYIDPLRRV